MTEGSDKVYAVNHNQIDSIAHRTVRYLKVAEAARCAPNRSCCSR